jgi:hypothetical protein
MEALYSIRRARLPLDSMRAEPLESASVPVAAQSTEASTRAAPRTVRLLLHAVYLVLSLLFASRFFPLAHPKSFAIPEGDPALMAWALQWVSHVLVNDPIHFFARMYAGNAFFPYSHAIALSDPMVTLAILNAPVRWFSTNPWVGYDLLVVAAYYLSCVWGAALARALTASDIVAVWGGIFWAFLFFRVHHIGHLQILSFQAIPAAMVALLRFWKAPDLRRALLFVLVFVAQALVSWYLAVIMVAVLLIVAVFQRRQLVASPGLVKYYVVMVALSAAVILPFALPYRQAMNDSSLADRRALAEQSGDAVRAADYLTPPSATALGQLVPNNQYWIWGENTLYAGFVPLLLSVVALRFVHRAPRDTLMGVALVVVGYVLALGFASTRLAVPLPLHYLAQAVPALGGLRATQRFSLVIYMGLLVMSSLGLSAAIRNLSRRTQTIVVGIASVAFLLEVFPFSLPVHASTPYAISAPDRAISSLQRRLAKPLVVLHLPINYFREPNPVSEAVYMLDSTAHWARLVNGYSGGFPSGFMDRMKELNTLPAPAAVRLMLDLDVDVLAVHRGTAQSAAILDHFKRQSWARIIPLSGDEFLVVIDKPRARE